MATPEWLALKMGGDLMKGRKTIYRALWGALLAAAILPMTFGSAAGDTALRTELGIIRSFHPDSDRNYAIWHPWIGVNAPLIGEWLRVRTGIVRTSHHTWGPFLGVTAAWEVAERWRAGVSAGVSGNYTRGHWLRRGALPVVQWQEEDSNLVWEVGFMRHPDTTFLGFGVHIPFSEIVDRGGAGRAD
ncbi:MAG: hypothetical protein OXI95_20275 [bacterium]|nr:hypothetical protein [bacterium]